MAHLHRNRAECCNFFMISKWTKLHLQQTMPAADSHQLGFFLHVLSLDVRHADVRLQSDPDVFGRFGSVDSGWHGHHGYSPFAGDPSFNVQVHYAGEDGEFLRCLNCRLIPFFLWKLSLEVYLCDQTGIIVDGRLIDVQIPNLCLLVRVALKSSVKPGRPTPQPTRGVLPPARL